MAQSTLSAPPFHEIAPENDASNDGESWRTEPFAGGGIRNAREDREFLRIERLIEAALFQHILKPDIAQLFVPCHGGQSPLAGHGMPSAADWKAIEMPCGQPLEGRTARQAGTVVQPISERDGVVTYLQSGCRAKLNKKSRTKIFVRNGGLSRLQ